MSERSKKRRAERRAKEQVEYREALFEYGEGLDAAERAKGVSEAELILRRTAAGSYMREALAAGETDKHLILNNMARIIRGMEPLVRRGAKKPPPRR